MEELIELPPCLTKTIATRSHFWPGSERPDSEIPQALPVA